MAPKKQTKEELLRKAKLKRRERYAKIKADPVKYALEKEKEHQRYLKRKAQKKILSIEEMTPKAKRQQRKKWRENFNKYYRKKLIFKRGLQLIDANTPSNSDTEDPLMIDEMLQDPEEPGPSNHCHDAHERSQLESSTSNNLELSNTAKKDLVPTASNIQLTRHKVKKTQSLNSTTEFQPSNHISTITKKPQDQVSTPSKLIQLTRHKAKEVQSSNSTKEFQPSNTTSTVTEKPQDQVLTASKLVQLTRHKAKNAQSLISTQEFLPSNPTSIVTKKPLPSSQKKISNSCTLHSQNAAQNYANLMKKINRLQYIINKKDTIYKLKINSMEAKLKNYRKYIYRLKKKMQSPNTKVEVLIKDKSKIQELKKKVLFGEAIQTSLKTNYSKLQSKKAKKEFSDNILQDKTIFKERKVLMETKPFTVRDKKTTEKVDGFEKLRQDIQAFFERDDVSRMTSGKKECITLHQIKKQKRYLLDSMKQLHKTFEKQFGKVSYSYFCKQRPFWVLIPDVKNRDTCVCKTHENFCLLIQSLNKREIIKEKRFQDVIETLCCPNTTCLLKRCNACKNRNMEYLLDKDEPVSFYKWDYKKETYVSKGVEKQKRVIEKVNVSVSPKEAIEIFENAIPVFLKHEGLRRWQYNAISDLKANLKDNEAIINVDFSENYAFKYETEVQSFHFGGSRKELTLHTAVLYFIAENEKLTCSSFCSVSENMRHDAAAVWAHILPLLEHLQKIKPNVTTVHFLSDSPSSQYRNKTMYYIISKLHWNFENIRLITWNYSEAGHGKNAADGVGATVKRSADNAVAQGKDISSLDEFMAAMKQISVNLEIVTDYQISEKDLLLHGEKLQPVKGSTKVHQVLWRKDNKYFLVFREESCFICLHGDCEHTTLVGKLNYDKTSSNVFTENLSVQLPHKVEPKTTRLQKSTKKQTTSASNDLRMLPSTSSKYNSNKKALQITSNILLKSALNQQTKDTNNERVTRLSDVTPDSKMNLSVDITDLVDLYNVSNIEGNFSGVFDDFINSRNSPQLSNVTDIFNGDLEVDKSESTTQLQSVENTEMLPRNQSETKNNETDSDEEFNIF